jgi:uncharacterized membrane protein YccC
VGEVSAVVLWIIILALAICLLGIVCSWILQARSRLEPAQPADLELRKRLEAKANALYSRTVQDNTFGGRGA